MNEDSNQKERCNKKAEGKSGFLRIVSQIQRAKKPKNALYINRIYFARQSCNANINSGAFRTFVVK